MAALGRLLTAMVTPFDDEGQVDYEQAKRLALALLESGSDGVVLCGTTGEAPTLNREEKLRLFSEVRAAVGGRGQVVASTGSYSTRESTELTREAERIAVDAALLVVPYYSKPTQAGLLEHFKAIAAGTSLPCILYNVPSRTITSLAADTVLALSKIDNIVGLKEASGNFQEAAKVIAGSGDDFLVYSGNDTDTFHLMSLGGYGVISVASHLVGVQIKKMIDMMVAGEIREAATVHHRLLPLVNTLFVLSNPMPVKHALNALGFPVGRPRLPLTEPDAKTAAHIEATVGDYRVDLPLVQLRTR
ncbi:4-hydroxy-tetrahydrodipicolinate synthase [Chloroflexota bacterium]